MRKYVIGYKTIGAFRENEKPLQQQNDDIVTFINTYN